MYLELRLQKGLISLFVHQVCRLNEINLVIVILQSVVYLI